ncbi:MAG: helix-turn-helix transcriptional regulator [Ruminococcaceae bacterium]|nr:helix-turn-helix transcriptional regulator [Oscillospiraceae bacterium]
MTIGQKLSEKRRRAGLTQECVSEHLGVTPQAVSKWENDVSCPDISLLPEIARLYKTTVDEILSCEPEREVALISENVRKDVNDMVLHVSVCDGGDKVKINLPLILVTTLVESESIGNINIGNVNMANIDFKAILAMTHSGVVGRLLEIESEDGATVVIEVD